MTWIPFSMAVSEDGKVRVSGKEIGHLLMAHSLFSERGDRRALLRFSKEQVAYNVQQKWFQVYEGEHYERVNGPYLVVRNACYILAAEDQGHVTACADGASEVWGGSGLDVMLNLI